MGAWVPDRVRIFEERHGGKAPIEDCFETGLNDEWIYNGEPVSNCGAAWDGDKIRDQAIAFANPSALDAARSMQAGTFRHAAL